MSTDTTTPPTIDHKPHATFFRQSGWLMIATIIGGAMTFGMHFLNKKIPDAEYAIFVTLAMTTACVPAVPLQMVFAQQSAEALAMGRERQLAGMIRLALGLTVVLWLIAVMGIVIFQRVIVNRWQLPDAWGLWWTSLSVLAYLWVPLFAGLMQGRQDFFWYGWSVIIGGFARIAAGAVIVFTLWPTAAGLMFGLLVGFFVTA